MKVVVGIGSSPAAAEALRWAARYARAVGAEIHAVHAYLGPQWEAIALPTDSNVQGKLSRALQSPEDVRGMFASVQPEPGWTLTCSAGDPRPVLADSGRRRSPGRRHRRARRPRPAPGWLGEPPRSDARDVSGRRGSGPSADRRSAAG